MIGVALFVVDASVGGVESAIFFFQAEDGIRDLVRSRGLGDVYKRQVHARRHRGRLGDLLRPRLGPGRPRIRRHLHLRSLLSLIHI
mgnify:CR=1 FL=1